MIPLASDVLTAVRAQLGDDVDTGGSIFTDAVLIPHFKAAYGDLFRELEEAQAPRILRECFYNVPANTSILSPATAGITNLGEVEAVEERGSITAKAVTGATPSSPSAGILALTVVGHGFTTGSNVTTNGIQGVSDDVNDIWTITVQSANVIQLNGCTATGTYTAATGTASVSGEGFQPMTPVDRITDTTIVGSDRFMEYAWQGDVLRFHPASNLRQIHIVYNLSGSITVAVGTTNVSTGVDDSLDFLTYRTAYRAARSRDLAMTPDLATDSQVVLDKLINSMVRAKQGIVWRSPPFRSQRNAWGLY